MITTNTNQEKLKYVMCGNNTCCPVLTEIEDNKFNITDDYNGKVLLTKEELILLKNFLNEKIND